MEERVKIMLEVETEGLMLDLMYLYGDVYQCLVELVLDIDQDYGADIDGNRGVTMVTIDDYRIIQVDNIVFDDMDRDTRHKISQLVSDRVFSGDFDLGDYL